jgi:hypothetical protein
MANYTVCNGSNTTVCALPGPVATGDLILVWFYQVSSFSISSSGYIAGPNGAFSNNMSYKYLVATGGETSITFTRSGTFTKQFKAVMIRITGANSSNPILIDSTVNTTPVSNSATNMTINAPTVTPTSATGLVLSLYLGGHANTTTVNSMAIHASEQSINSTTPYYISPTGSINNVADQGYIGVGYKSLSTGANNPTGALLVDYSHSAAATLARAQTIVIQ